MDRPLTASRSGHTRGGGKANNKHGGRGQRHGDAPPPPSSAHGSQPIAFPLSYEDTSTFQLPNNGQPPKPPATASKHQAHPSHGTAKPSKPPKMKNPAFRSQPAPSHPPTRHRSQRVESKEDDDDEEDDDDDFDYFDEDDEFDFEDDDEDDPWTNDESTIFDMAEEAMMDGKRLQDIKNKQQQQTQSSISVNVTAMVEEPRRKLTVVTKKQRQQQQQQQQQQQHHSQQPHNSHSSSHSHPHPDPHSRPKSGKPSKSHPSQSDSLESHIGSGTSRDPTLTRRERAYLRAKEEAELMRKKQGHNHQTNAPTHSPPQPQKQQQKQSKQNGKNSKNSNGNSHNSGAHRPASATGDNQRDQSKSNNDTPSKNSGSSRHRDRAFFAEHLSLSVMQIGLKQGLYVQGVLRIVGSNGFVAVEGLPRDVFIDGRRSRNRAFDGDTVCIEIVGVDSYGSKTQPSHSNQAAANAKQASLNKNSSKSKNHRQASLQASLDSLILNSELAEDMKMEQERNVKNGSNNHELPPVEDEDDVKEANDGVSGASPAAAYLAHLASFGTDVQHKGVVLGILSPKFPVLHVPGILKPFAERMALFVPLDKRTPFAMVPERTWPDVWRKEYRQYLMDQAAKKAQKNQSKREHKVKGNFPLSPDDSSNAVIEETPTPTPTLPTPSPSPSDSNDDDAMTQAADANSVTLDPNIYVAIYQAWDSHDRLPFCKIASTLGLSGNIIAETEALLIGNGVDYDLDGKFEQVVLDEVASYSRDAVNGGWQIPQAEIEARRDMRDQTKWHIVSIDPTTAKDLDDAIHIKDLGEDEVEIGVHIADVSYFVKPGTALDAEARHRATTIYLVNKALPMLPPILCEQLCSLNPNVNRLAYSCIFYISKTTGKLSTTKPPWFGRTVIRTAARLNYETAQWLMEFDRSKLNGRPATEHDFTGDLKANMSRGHPYRPVDCVSIDELLSDMQLLHRVSMLRRADRFQNGSLTLSNVKLQFKLDEQRNPCGFYTYPIYDSNRVVEECMLLANLLVAHQCVTFCKNVALLRRHPPPNEKSMQRVAQSCKELGFDIDASTAGTLQASLEAYEEMFVGKVHGVNDEACIDGKIPIRQVLEPMCTKPMTLALYFCTNETNSKDWHHFALNFAEYTHFTSPIRRYADVIVHRVLTYSLQLEAWKAKGGVKTRPRAPPSLTPEEVVQVAEQCNTRKANAKKCQEQSSKVYLCDYLLRCHPDVPLTSSAVITDVFGVTGNSDQTFDIIIPHLGIEKKIHLNDLIKQGKIQAGYVEPLDPPEVGKQGGKNNNNSKNNTNNKTKNNQSKASSSTSSSSTTSVPASAPSLLAPVAKSDKRLHLTWPDGSRNCYSIFDSIDVELLVRRGPPIDVDAAVIGPLQAEERRQKTQS